MDCKTPYIKIFLWLFLFFQKVDFKFTTQEKHENITFLGITFLSDHLQKWQTPFWNRLNELHLIISFVCHKQLVLYHKKILLALVRSRFCAFQQFVYFCHSATPGIIILVLPNILLFIVLFGEYLNLQRDKSTLGNKTISRTFKVLALSQQTRL